MVRCMENFRIESLEINKIGAFEHLKMDFPKKKDPEKAEIHILTGENGTGKSTVLEVLAHCIPPFDKDDSAVNQLKGLLVKISSINEFYFQINNNSSDFMRFGGDGRGNVFSAESEFRNYIKKIENFS